MTITVRLYAVRGAFLILVLMFAMSCGSSKGVEADFGDATVTESKADVSGCEYVARVTAGVDLRDYDGDRAAALEALFDRLRNNTLHKRCDTVYLLTVTETRTHLEALGEGYRCERPGITDGPMGGTLP